MINKTVDLQFVKWYNININKHICIDTLDNRFN